MTNISDSETEDEEEFFDAVDAGEVDVVVLPPATPVKLDVKEKSKELVLVEDIDLSTSFHGYEDGVRKRLKMDADDRPKISLWVSLPWKKIAIELN